jgi:hypothetical protein
MWNDTTYDSKAPPGTVSRQDLLYPCKPGCVTKKGIKLLAKPLGKPSAVKKNVSPGERNSIEGKFGQSKTAYGFNRIKARLRNTSELWIGCIFLVLYLVKLAGMALPCLLTKIFKRFSAKIKVELV